MTLNSSRAGTTKQWLKEEVEARQACWHEAEASSYMHTHITSVVYTSSAELPVDPCTLAHQPILIYQEEQGPPFHTGIKDTVTLAHQLNMPVSMENIHGLDTGL